VGNRAIYADEAKVVPIIDERVAAGGRVSIGRCTK